MCNMQAMFTSKHCFISRYAYNPFITGLAYKYLVRCMLDNVILMLVSIYTTGNQLSATAKTSLVDLANK